MGRSLAWGQVSTVERPCRLNIQYSICKQSPRRGLHCILGRHPRISHDYEAPSAGAHGRDLGIPFLGSGRALFRMGAMVTLYGKNCLLRSWRMDDAPSVAMYANNRAIWRNLRDVFPNPFTLQDAREWLVQRVSGCDDSVYLAIDVGGQAVGSIVCRLFQDIDAKNGEIGYWLGEPFWGRGVVGDAVRVFCDYLFDDLDLVRLQANVFGWNPASGRVLEKAGFELEGRLRKAVFKDGEVTDRLIYGKLNPAWDRGTGVAASLEAFASAGTAP